MAFPVPGRALRLAAFLLAFAVSAADLAVAADTPMRARNETGEMHWQRCKDGPTAPKVDWESCRYFVAVAHEYVSIAEFMTMAPASEKICFPEKFDEDLQVKVYYDYLRDHPDERSLRAIELYHKAMRQVYPCKE
jgi:hypothetical protein